MPPFAIIDSSPDAGTDPKGTYMKKLPFIAATALAITVLGACSSEESTSTTTAKPATTSTAKAPETIAPETAPTTEAAPSTTPPPKAELTPEMVVAAFKAAGLEAEDPIDMAEEAEGIAPALYTSGVHFFVPSIEVGAGGRVMTFASDEELAEQKSYYDDFGDEGDPLFSWTFTNGRILVQINGDLPAEKAHAYEAALAAL